MTAAWARATTALRRVPVPVWATPPLLFAYALGPVVLLLLWIFRDAGLVADHPMWVYAAVVLGPDLSSTAANVAYARRPSGATLHARAATDALATTLIIYSTGWGPAIGLAYLVAAQQLVAATGPRSWRVCRLWTLAGIAAGQTAVALDVAPSYLRSPIDIGIAALGMTAFLLVSQMAEAISADRERGWEAARASNERFVSLVQSSSDMIVVLDEESRAIYVGGASQRILGVTAERLQDTDLGSLVHPDDFEPVRQCLRQSLLHPGPTPPVEMRVRHADGEWRHLEAIGTNQRDNTVIGGVVLNVRDVTDRKRAESELAHSAVHDALTGLPNRALFIDRLAHSLRRPWPDCEQPAVLFLDVDRFKLINDSLGHDSGDRLLQEAARRLRTAVRSGDTVARFGGDEFVVLCEPPGDPAAVAQRLLAVFDEPFRLAGQDFYLSASVGVASRTATTFKPADLIRDADTAMYKAKELGRGRLHVFDQSARTAALARMHAEHLLRGAAERGELKVFYQPIIDIATGRLVATEALLRWEHPALGLIGPGSFMETAEDSGLIVPIGDWVLRQALEQGARWADAGHAVDMSVNVSARQLAEDGVTCEMDELLRSHLRGSRRFELVLEVTESALIRDPITTAERVRSLKELGALLAMDDFGTGHSSLANLRRYPFDILKVDQRFVGGLADNADDGAIVAAIIDLAHRLRRTVVAEGIESVEQLSVLRELGCDQGQGFHIGVPQPPTDDPHDLLISRLAGGDAGHGRSLSAGKAG